MVWAIQTFPHFLTKYVCTYGNLSVLKYRWLWLPNSKSYATLNNCFEKYINWTICLTTFENIISYNKEEPVVLNRMLSSVLALYQKSWSSGGVNKWLSTHKKLPSTQCYHIVSDSRDVYLTKNHDENYWPRMVPVAKNYWVWFKA